MSGRIPESFIAEVIQRTDLASLIGRHVPLRKTGREFVGLCPFHNEKTPSFTVSPSKRIFHCFGCGASGNGVRFLMEHARMPFLDAIEQLAREAGMEMPRRQLDESPAERARRALMAALDAAAEHYQRQLSEHPQARGARDCLQRRGISEDSIRRWRIGFAPSAPTLLSALGATVGEERLADAGLLAASERDPGQRYERFRNRIMFPIRERSGKVIGFGARAMDPNARAKYLNSPETPVFQKRRALYGLHEVHQRRRLERLALVEGYLDAIALDQLADHAAVASLGTALSAEQLELAFAECPELALCFDGDAAGRLAAERALDPAVRAMRDGRSIRFASLPDGEDPDSYVRKRGPEAFAELVERAVPLSDFMFQTLSRGLDAGTPEGAAQLCQRALPLLSNLRAGIYAETLRRRLSERLGLPAESFERAARAMAPGGERRTAPARPEAAVAGQDRPPALADDGFERVGSTEAEPAPARRRASRMPDEGDWAERALVVLLLRPGLAGAEELALPECARAHPRVELLLRVWELLAGMPDDSRRALTPKQAAAALRNAVVGDADAAALARAGESADSWPDLDDEDCHADALRGCLERMAEAGERRERRRRLGEMSVKLDAAQRDALRDAASWRSDAGERPAALDPEWLEPGPPSRGAARP